MKKMVILTGAGMSAESGIATFRDSNGLWENNKIEDVASIDGFIRNPKLVLDFYNKRRKEALQAEPNQGHRLLAELERKYNMTIITQNVDNLHERAGSKHVIHLHGELMKARSINNPSKTYDIDPAHSDIEWGDKDQNGDQLRPHIVWFGEAVPMIEKAIKATQESDIFIIIGTSLNVYPAAGLVDFVSSDTSVFLIDPKDVKTKRNNVYIIQEIASKGIITLIEYLNKMES